MTTNSNSATDEICPAHALLKTFSGKWKPELFRSAVSAPLRFNSLLKQLPGANKQSLSVALKELEEAGILSKLTVKLKPLHIEYHLTDKGQQLIPIFEQLELLQHKR
ncbi:winged helix-turn-helix transcriptional regulator [Mucilaginibacter myungsuensis]|uniref:Helix-turn-helix transcriptional regulator n=1 Tax=Mucilaginibacter myungsuensis TaxID=649104 RepID=A0A929KX93_9SPHI|nr:helix-turn-helix domain-containing protein [Mucilaginibacter myungsuensis]MBE9663326.1 helix-turn-helix transcriptional regulator [Mucilaginibacter myungsuensis]MDN3600061.1 helix-turn-helix domain-containing protein [Mucilaginibacter myungsuensis]